MKIYINDIEYKVEMQFIGFDRWENRNVCEVTMFSDYETVNTLFCDNMQWGYEEDIVDGVPYIASLNQYCIRGPITAYDDYCVVKMGQPTEDELMAPIIELGTLAMEIGITIEAKPDIADNEALEPWLDGTVIRWNVITLPDPIPDAVIPPENPVVE